MEDASEVQIDAKQVKTSLLHVMEESSQTEKVSAIKETPTAGDVAVIQDAPEEISTETATKGLADQKAARPRRKHFTYATCLCPSLPRFYIPLAVLSSPGLSVSTNSFRMKLMCFCTVAREASGDWHSKHKKKQSNN